MVTIEQKLSLFSKLLQQDIKAEIGEKIEAMEKEYEGIMAEHKRKVDKDADDLIEHARKKAEIKRLELISKAKMKTKKESMIAKEKYIGIFIEQLKCRVQAFKETPGYKVYLEQVIDTLEHLEVYDTDFIVYMTSKDMTDYGEAVIEQIAQKGISKERLKLAQKEESMLGGVILDSPEKNLRIDLSIRTLIEDHKDEIVKQLFHAIGEVGGLDE